MIDFIFAGIIYLAIMFVVFFITSFVTIGIAYGTALFFRQWAQKIHRVPIALK